MSYFDFTLMMDIAFLFSTI